VNPVVLLLPSKFQLKSSFGNNHSALQLLARRGVEGTLHSPPQLGVFSTMREDPHLTFRGLPRGILNPTNFLHIYALWKTVQLARPFDSKRHGDMLSSKRLKNTHQTRFKFASI